MSSNHVVQNVLTAWGKQASAPTASQTPVNRADMERLFFPSHLAKESIQFIVFSLFLFFLSSDVKGGLASQQAPGSCFRTLVLLYALWQAQHLSPKGQLVGRLGHPANIPPLHSAQLLHSCLPAGRLPWQRVGFSLVCTDFSSA